MKIIRKNEQKIVNSNSCGLLTEVLNSDEFGASIILVEDLKPTLPHFHKLSTETYWVIEGTVTLTVNDRTIVLEEGDMLIIDTGNKHQVIKASIKNKIVVISHPRWKIEDEYLV